MYRLENKILRVPKVDRRMVSSTMDVMSKIVKHFLLQPFGNLFNECLVQTFGKHLKSQMLGKCLVRFLCCVSIDERHSAPFPSPAYSRR